MKKFGLIGRGISHSLSPALFECAYPGTTDRYLLLDRLTFKEAIQSFCADRYSAANVTSPFKEDAYSGSVPGDKIVEESGAANLIVAVDNTLVSYNTDYYGVLTPILNRNITKGTALLLGAGGAAKVAVLALKSAGLDVMVVNRTASKAKELAGRADSEWAEVEILERLPFKPVLIVNTIDHALSTFLNADLSQTYIFEANYKSPTLQNIKCREYIRGTEWLVSQAIPSFEIMTGRRPNTEAMNKMARNC